MPPNKSRLERPKPRLKQWDLTNLTNGTTYKLCTVPGQQMSFVSAESCMQQSVDRQAVQVRPHPEAISIRGKPRKKISLSDRLQSEVSESSDSAIKRRPNPLPLLPVVRSTRHAKQRRVLFFPQKNIYADVGIFFWRSKFPRQKKNLTIQI